MAFRYVHPDGPEYGHCVELSDAEYALVKKALCLAMDRVPADEHDLTELFNDLEPLEDDAP